MIPVLKVNLPPVEALNHLIKEIDRSSILKFWTTKPKTKSKDRASTWT